MDVLPADLDQRLAAAARRAPGLIRAARERRRAVQRRSLSLHRAVVEQQLAAAERRLRPLLLVALGWAVGLLALPAILLALWLEAAPPADLNIVDVGLPYTLLTIALITVALWPHAFRPYVLLTRACLVRALLTYALMEEASQTGDLLFRAALSQARKAASLAAPRQRGAAGDAMGGVDCPTVPILGLAKCQLTVLFRRSAARE